MSVVLKLIFSEVWKEIIQPLVKFIIRGEGAALWKAAKAAVASIEADPTLWKNDEDGSKRRAAAWEIIRNKLAQDHIVIRNSTGNLFIELALKYVTRKWAV